MKEFKTWYFSYIGTHIALKQDKGVQISVDELEKLMANKELLPWIESIIGPLDFLDIEVRLNMEEEFFRLATTYDNFEIENDGMALLITLCFKSIDVLLLPQNKLMK